MLRALSPLIVLASLMGACVVAEDVRPEGGAEGERGGLGKADLVGSCELPNGSDFCGGKGTGNCWCDDACIDYGDCCANAGEVCGIGDDDDDDAAADDDVCGDVLCALACEHGFVTDDNGCEICECQGQFCGGIAAIQCPAGEICVGVGNFPDAGGTCQPDPEPEPDPEPTASCQDACGGASDAGCWCDDLCTGFGDCCEDYEAQCVEPPAGTPCGTELCDTDETCVSRVTQLGLQPSCAPISAACEGEPTCACMGQDVCTGVFDACSENPEGGLFCGCPVC